MMENIIDPSNGYMGVFWVIQQPFETKHMQRAYALATSGPLHVSSDQALTTRPRQVAVTRLGMLRLQ